MTTIRPSPAKTTPPLGSVKARLAHSWPDSLSGDQLVKDDEGRTQLHAMPKAKRSSMIPDPWRTNPVGRFWDRLRGRDVTPRYLSRLTQEERESEQNGVPSAPFVAISCCC